MKITDAIISMIIRKGLLYEGKNVEVDFDVPTVIDGEEKTIKIKVKAVSMTLEIEKES